MGNLLINSYTTTRFFSSNVFFLESERGNILIDPGYYNEEIKKRANNKGLQAILLTHGHADHIRFVDEIISEFPKTSIYIHEYDLPLLKDEKLNCSFYIGNSKICVNSKVQAIREGELNIGGYLFEVIHVPGHTNGSVMYYLKEDNVLFSGDMILGESVGTPDTPTGNVNDLRSSIKKIKNFGFSSSTLIYQGHGKVLSFEEILTRNPFFKE